MGQFTAAAILAAFCMVGGSAVLGQTPTPTTTPVFVDEFSGTAINSAVWKARGFDGLTVTQANQRLEIGIDRTWSGVGDAGYTSVGALRGDFDIQVDYTLVNWPNMSGIRAGLYVGIPAAAFVGGTVQRLSCGRADCSGENYAVDFGTMIPGSSRVVATSDRSGTLRLVRSGNTFTGYYRNGETWVAVQSATGKVFGDAPFGLTIWSGPTTFTGEDVKIAFDNFIVNQGELLLGADHCNGDRNLDGAVTVDEIIGAVNNALGSCPGPSEPESVSAE